MPLAGTLEGLFFHHLQRLFQLLVHRIQVLRHHLDIRQDRHEVGITLPTRHNVKMHMIGIPGPRDFTLVDTHVEPIGLHRKA